MSTDEEELKEVVILAAMVIRFALSILLKYPQLVATNEQALVNLHQAAKIMEAMMKAMSGKEG